MAVTAGAAVMLAGIVVIDRDHSGGIGLSALPGATGQPAPTGPTGGGSGGGMGGPPFPLQPPDMPSGPPNGYNSGSYPAPDQGNGISIYNSDAPQSPGGQGYSQAPNYPQQLQPANGTQPPNYDAPLQTAAQPSPAPHSAAPQQPEPSQPQQQRGQQSQSQEPQNSQQDGQRQQQCQQAADFYQITDMVWKTSGSAGSLAGGRPMPGRNGPGGGQCNCAPQQAGPQKQSPDNSNQNCTPAGFTETSPQDGTLIIDQTRWANAIKILTQGRKDNMSDQQLKIGLMTALRESQLINTGNSNTNPLDTALSAAVPGSSSIGPGLTAADRELSFRMADTDPNFFNKMPYTDYLGRSVVIDVSGDNDSVGLFQQRVPIYGSPNVTMDPWVSAHMFFERLKAAMSEPDPSMSDPDWAQAVQHSAPASYANWQGAANDLFDKVQGCPAIGRQE